MHLHIRIYLRERVTYICSICGEEVVGIEEHVRKKHGKKALKKEEVKTVLELEAEKADFVLYDVREFAFR